eukprot:13375891-Alexandrium_andersonii.AAC.1
MVRRREPPRRSRAGRSRRPRQTLAPAPPPQSCEARGGPPSAPTLAMAGVGLLGRPYPRWPG